MRTEWCDRPVLSSPVFYCVVIGQLHTRSLRPAQNSYTPLDNPFLYHLPLHSPSVLSWDTEAACLVTQGGVEYRAGGKGEVCCLIGNKDVSRCHPPAQRLHTPGGNGAGSWF